MTRRRAMVLTRALIPLAGFALLAGCLAEPRSDDELRKTPGFAGSDSSGGSVDSGSVDSGSVDSGSVDSGGGTGPLCSDQNLSGFNDSASRR